MCNSGDMCYIVLQHVNSMLPCSTQGKEYHDMARDKEPSPNPVGASS